MPPPFKPYIPKNIGELRDHLSSMTLQSPTFKDKTGYFPDQNIDTEFLSLKEGLKIIRKKLGEESYETLLAMADRMRTHFEADPGDKTEDGLIGRRIIQEMDDILRATARRQSSLPMTESKG